MEIRKWYFAITGVILAIFIPRISTELRVVLLAFAIFLFGYIGAIFYSKHLFKDEQSTLMLKILTTRFE